MRAWQISVAALGLVACTKTPAYLYGRDFSSLKLDTLTANEGIYPDTSILNDANNPFVVDPPSVEGKWELQSSAGPIAAFYSWATLNALTPGGEAQFYIGHNLETVVMMAQPGASAMPLSDVHDRAIRAFQAVLDNFPTSVTYDSTGKIAYSLANASCQGIVDLKGMILNGWALVMSADGTPQCVHR
jgi:hypothetical protein